MYIVIGIQITFFGFGLCLLQALERIMESRKLISPRVMFYIFNSIILLETGLIAKGILAQYPVAIFLLLTSIFIIGPLNLFYYRSLLFPFQKQAYYWIHLMPSALALLSELLFQMQPMPFKREFINSFLSDPAGHVLTVPLTFAAVHVLVYMFYILRITIFGVSFKKFKREFHFIGSIAVMVLLVVAMLYGGFVFSAPEMFISGSILNVFIHICLYLGMRLFPKFFDSLKKEIARKRYEKSMLRRVDKDTVLRCLMGLMEDDKIYCENDISLSLMADKLSLSTHQLSQFLNEYMKTGFHDFINSYRIKEAMKILEENRDANIMSVCFRVGFNSKSSFNTAFKKITGMTPSEFKNISG